MTTGKVEFIGPSGWTPLDKVTDIRLAPVSIPKTVSFDFHFDHEIGLPDYVNEEKEFCFEFDENERVDPKAAKESFDAATEAGHLKVGLRVTSQPVIEREGSIVRYKFKGIIEPE